jgi:hypothetical protein
MIRGAQIFKNYGCHHTKFSHRSDLLPSICVPLMVVVMVMATM